MSSDVVLAVLLAVTNIFWLWFNLGTIQRWERSSDKWSELCREQNNTWSEYASGLVRQLQDKEHTNG